MKKQRLILLFLVAILPMVAFAHAPKKVNLSYDTESGILSITVIHPVKDVEDHFIDPIVIKVNDVEVKKLEYKVQSSLESHKAEVELPDLKSGDIVNVKAACNKLGAKTAKLEIK